DQSPKTATIARMIPSGDSNLWLLPEASTAESANFSGDRSPTCDLMNMVCCFLAKFWIAQYVSYSYVYNKNFSSFFWRHEFPGLALLFASSSCSLVLPTTPCDALPYPTIVATSRAAWLVLSWTGQAACGSSETSFTHSLKSKMSCTSPPRRGMCKSTIHADLW